MRAFKLTVCSMFFAAGAAISPAVAGQLVQNGGFEDGVYSSTLGGNTDTAVPNGWTPDANFDAEASFNHVTTNPVESGSDALSIGNFDYQIAPNLSQTLSDASGANYAGSLYVNYGGGQGGDGGAFFDVQINGANVLALNDTVANGYQQYTFSFVGTGSDVLNLTANTNPSEWFVDDVSVLGAQTSVPEPITISLFGAGLAGAAALRRRKKKTA